MGSFSGNVSIDLSWCVDSIRHIIILGADLNGLSLLLHHHWLSHKLLLLLLHRLLSLRLAEHARVLLGLLAREQRGLGLLERSSLSLSSKQFTSLGRRFLGISE